MPNLDDILGGGPPAAATPAATPPAASGGGNLDSVLGGASPGGNLDSILGTPNGSAATPAAKKSGGGIFGSLANAFKTGLNHAGPLKQLASFVNPANQAEGLVKLADSAAQAAGIAPTQVLEHAKGIDPFYHSTNGRLSGSLAQAVTGAQQTVKGPNGQTLVAPGQRGLSVIAGETPAVYGAAAHVGNTVQGAVQLPLAAEQAATQQSTAPLANSILGRRVNQEGVLGAGLSTLGDTLLLAGAAGGITGGITGEGGVSGGDLAQATKLENLANSVKGSPEGGYASAAQADQMAQEAAANGDATQAAEHAQAAQNLSKAADLRAAVSESSPTMQRLNAVNQGLNTFTHAGNQVMGQPAEVYGKVLGGVGDLLTKIPGVEAAASAAKEGLANSKVGQFAAKVAANHAEGNKFRDLYRDQMSGETQRLQQPVNQATADVNRILPNAEDQQAMNLVRRGDVNTLTAPMLSKLSDEQLQAHIDRTGLDATPAALRTAVEYTANPASRPDITEAAQRMAAVQQAADARFTNPDYASQVLGGPALAEREAKVAGEASPGGVAKRQAAIDKMIQAQKDKIDAAMQQGLSERPAPLSAAQERQVAARNARADVTERLGTERQGTTTRAAADETNAATQSRASRKAVADAEREIAARSQRIADLQARQANVPNELQVQAPQVRTALQSADQIRSSLLQAAQEARATVWHNGDTDIPVTVEGSLGVGPDGREYLKVSGSNTGVPADEIRQVETPQSQSLAALAGKAAPTAADLRAAGINPEFLPGGQVPEEGVGQAGVKPRLLNAKKLGSERQRQTIEAPLTAEGQAAKYNENIAGQVRNELSRRVLAEVAQPSTAHVADTSLSGAALRQELEAQGRVPVGLVQEQGVAKLRPLPDEQIRPGVPTLSTKTLDRYTKTVFPSEPNAFMKGLSTVETAGRVTKLLGPGFVAHKAATDALFDRILGGVRLKDVAANAPEALRQYKEGTLPPDIGTLQKPDLSNSNVVDRAISKVAEKGMPGFRALDSTNRGALYQTFRDQGMSPLQAQERVRAVGGDIRAVNAQAGGLRRFATYPGWQFHLANVLKELAVAHPSGLIQAGTLAQAANRAQPDTVATTGGVDEFVNPFGSFIGLGKGTPGKGLKQQIQGRIGSMIAPVPETVAEWLGNDLRRGQPVTVPGVNYPQAAGSQLGNWGNMGNIALHTFVPQVGQVGDVVGAAQGPGGEVPYRLSTGNPEENSKGVVQTKKGSTRLGALAQLAGVPVATPVQPPKPKKGKK